MLIQHSADEQIDVIEYVLNVINLPLKMNFILFLYDLFTQI